MYKMAEATGKIQRQIAPNPGVKFVAVKATSTADGDIITVSNLQKIEGAIGFATDGTPGSYSFATNVITLNNGGTKTWNFNVWGV